MVEKELGGAPLAYIGDAVIELWVRETLISIGIRSSAACNAEALLFVTARSQSEAFSHIEPCLSPDETEIFKRGRNAHVTTPKSATAAEYHRATGLEALIGALYLDGKRERAYELLSVAYRDVISGIRARHHAESGDKD